MERLRDVFQRHFFISRTNVEKILVVALSGSVKANTAVPPPFPLSVLKMSKPLRRCKTCTLLPPCAHVTTAMLLDRIEQIRHVYPHQNQTQTNGDTRTPQLPVCPSFRETGVCRNMQALGRCRYAHPLTLHAIDTSQIVQRCKTHTLPVPCAHCTNVRALHERLRDETKTCVALETQLRVRQTQLSELEMRRFQLARERSKSVKWGAAKREVDDQLASLDEALTVTRCEVDALSDELVTAQTRRGQLEIDCEHRVSRGTLSQARCAA